jgi:hypothetical protein
MRFSAALRKKGQVHESRSHRASADFHVHASDQFASPFCVAMSITEFAQLVSSRALHAFLTSRTLLSGDADDGFSLLAPAAMGQPSHPVRTARTPELLRSADESGPNRVTSCRWLNSVPVACDSASYIETVGLTMFFSARLGGARPYGSFWRRGDGRAAPPLSFCLHSKVCRSASFIAIHPADT